jgi:hypothetical protein
MRKILVSIVVFMTVFPAIAQEEKEKKISVEVYGFVRNDFYYESRKSLTAAGGLFHLIPLDQDLNELNEDLNAVPSSKFVATASRIGLKVNGPDVWGATASARIEGDFDGFSSDHISNAVFRIRQAWVKLAWENAGLLAGQTWHPMFGDVMPSVLSLATGSPFQPFNRSPQIRVDYRMGNFRTYLSALYQLQSLSAGPYGSSANYLRDGILPELYLGIDYARNGWIAGAGIDFMRLRPRVIGEVNMEIDGVQQEISTKVPDNISSLSFNAFLQYSKDKFAVKAKTIYGQNMAHLSMLSGYGVSKINDDGSWEYSNLTNSTSWLNITYGAKYQAGLFLGYSKNLGSPRELLPGKVYTFGASNIDQAFRISPEISYNLKHWTFGVEYEMTTVSYGAMDFNNGKVKNTHKVTNNRLAAIMVYYF